MDVEREDRTETRLQDEGGFVRRSKPDPGVAHVVIVGRHTEKLESDFDSLNLFIATVNSQSVWNFVFLSLEAKYETLGPNINKYLQYIHEFLQLRDSNCAADVESSKSAS